MEKVWSQYQKDIFENIANGVGHTLVVARAGSSKTSSLIEGSKYIPAGKTSLFCAFNKSIQEELQNKLPGHVKSLTLHSLGFQEIRKRFKCTVNQKKTFQIVDAFIPKQDLQNKNINPFDVVNSVCKTVEWCKNTLTDSPDKIEDIINNNDIDICDVDMNEFVQYVSFALRKCKEITNEIDFTDMIWFPFIYNLHSQKFDFVFCDELQDLNKAQIELALAAIKKNGRFFGIGDDRQALYGWRGADSTSFPTLRTRLSPKEFTLPICYRCPKKVIELAQKFVPDIQYFDKAIDGEITNIPNEELFKLAKIGDSVISRTNAPLIKNCFRLLKAGIPANILGRDISEGLFSIVKKSKKRDIDSFLTWLKNWKEKEINRLRAKDPQADVEHIQDKVECLQSFCDEAKSMKEVSENIEKLFKENDKSRIVTLSSCHRAKGFEYDNVFLLDTFRNTSLEEKNIKYVAVTRAKKKLFFVKKNYSEETKNVIDF
jgi:DNA helicase II / ATP-dependent DNA helicase PcrA